MMVKMRCACGKVFTGQRYKEDTCPKCLKNLLNKDYLRSEIIKMERLENQIFYAHRSGAKKERLRLQKQLRRLMK